MMMDVVWKPIPGWPGYKASSTGEVRCDVDRGKYRAGRLLKGALFNNGYLYICSTWDGVRVKVAKHRLICEAFHGPAPQDKPLCRHLDGNTLHNAPDNLAWGSAVDNSEDSRVHGSLAQGNSHGNSKLREDMIEALFELRAAGRSGRQIAALFGMNRNTINKVLARTAWAHVAVPEDLVARAQAVSAKRAFHSKKVGARDAVARMRMRDPSLAGVA